MLCLLRKDTSEKKGLLNSFIHYRILSSGNDKMPRIKMNTTCKGPDSLATPLLLSKNCPLVILKGTLV